MAFAGEGVIVWFIRILVILIFLMEMWWLWRSRQGHRPFHYEFQGLDAEAERLMEDRDWVLLGYQGSAFHDCYKVTLEFQDRKSFEAEHRR